MTAFDAGGSAVPAEEALRGFLNVLGVPPAEVPEGTEAQAGLYRSLLSERRLLIVLDNARDVTADIRAAFSWSYRPLRPPAARLFRLLSVHSGPDISVGAVASLAGLSVRETRSLLDELGGARLVTERSRRFAFHDLIRIYAAEFSAATDTDAERGAARERLLDLHTAHAARVYFGPHFMREAPPPAGPGVSPEGIYGPRHAVAWFSAERYVLKVVIAEAVSHGHHLYAFRLALTMREFYQCEGLWGDCAEVMRTAVAAAQRQGDLAAEAYARHGLSGAYRFLGHDAESRTELQRSDEILAMLG